MDDGQKEGGGGGTATMTTMHPIQGRAEAQIEQNKSQQAKLESELEIKRAKLKAKLAAAQALKQKRTHATAGGDDNSSGRNGKESDGTMGGTGVPGLNPNAASFRPRLPKQRRDRSKSPKRDLEAKESSNTFQRIPKKKRQSKSLAESKPLEEDETPQQTDLAARNAERFAPKQNLASLSMLPKELQEQVRNGTDVGSMGQRAPTDDEEDEEPVGRSPAISSKSLQGTCRHMCPDEELLRREREGDIQLLEMPHDAIHPKGWNLRNTAVKRFKRSAADFKLDIPELIRPPEVLERVCGKSYKREYTSAFHVCFIL